MARKKTYFGKHREKLEAAGDGDSRALPRVEISDEQRKPFEEGSVLLIDKPLHWTSFDIVRKIRNTVHIKKVGHAGTLDPLASGLLIVCTGKFTKRINEFMAKEKEYIGSITLGATTPTYDLESDPENFISTDEITELKIRNLLPNFTGDIWQKPPVYSAIKKDGEALYQLARRGDEVDLQARPVTIFDFEITSIEMPVLAFRVKCSTGTYIRSLAHDFGHALGCGGYLSALRRTKIGEFHVDYALTPLEFLQKLQSNQNG